MKNNQSLGVYIIVGIIALIVLAMVFAGPVTSTSEISYSEFVEKVENGDIKSVTIAKDILFAIPSDNQNSEDQSSQTKTPSDDFASRLIAPVGQDLPVLQYKVRIPENDPKFYPLLEAAGVEINLKKPQDGSILGTLGSILLPLFFIGLIILILRGIQDRKSTRLNSSHITRSRMPSSA